MNERKGIPFWLQITMILLLGVLTSLIVRMVYLDADANLPRYTVTFAYQDGTVIETKEVSEGKGIYPPEYMGDGIFRGWSGRFNQVTADVEVHPILHGISEDNFFYFHSIYVEEGKKFTLDVHLGGRVSLSSGELTVFYDPEVLEYLESDPMDCCEAELVGEGELKLTFSSQEPIREEKLLAKLHFRALEKNAYSTEVQLQAKNMMIVTAEGEKPADCATINNKVYFLQEVEP